MESFGIDWQAVEENLQMFILLMIILIIAVFIVVMGVLWFFIKSAVREGVKEAFKQSVADVRLFDVEKNVIINSKNVIPTQPYTEKYSGEPYNEKQF